MQEDEEAGLMEQIKSQICDNIGLYAQQYDEEFRNYLPDFVTDIWNLLVSTGIQPKYDMVSFLQYYPSEDRAKNLVCSKITTYL